jgi:polyisoprenoid-binding protein YceI
MKRPSLLKILLLLILNSTICVSAIAQTVYKTEAFDIRLNGTSSLHDWEMKAVKGNSVASFTVNAKGKLASLSRLSFTLPVTNLKSSKKSMDKNTYKALHADKNPNISFVLTSATVTDMGENTYELNCKGKMTIAGTSIQTQLMATSIYNPADKSFTVTGIKKMKMTDYKVKPPKALLGTITTGDDISISYNIKYSR